ncbi:MAG: DMT family transporter [Paracoccaceae bacterium]
MRLVLLTTITMIAFASNSVLNRLAVDSGDIDPSSFALIRVLSGAIALFVILKMRGGALNVFAPGRLAGAGSLALYMIGFSLAYKTLDAGLGALILFGTVQVATFGWSMIKGVQLGSRVLGGAAIAFIGLLVALWPDKDAAFGVWGAVCMLGAGIGWAIYTMLGRSAKDPLAETASNFLIALIPMLALLLGSDLWAQPFGIALAVLSGAVTSGMGYALWYTLMPTLGGPRAAVIQLSAPLIAILGGVLLLGENLTLQLVLSTAFVIGGIAVAITSQSSQAGRK